ncbi:MAG: Asp-tRNA(Asn)/Glu-tRNA(Gln) amidotransferase subunit GatB [Phycisphaeraceae bacterium]|nr:Asp-tRNA(Asn)/Glu-tRNA(Gln) amidotransferase subunit GatB [Phycisphaeraceae bacterium]
MASVVASTLIVGMEIHVELATRSKMFSRAPSPACAEFQESPPNTCIDPVVLGLPGALPVVNRSAVDMAMAVGLALGCRVAEVTRWDRKGYFYPDLPKGYQISQYDLPICFDGAIDLPAPAAGQKPGGSYIAIDDALPARRIGIIRAHLEEDAGKLLHEAPGGGAIDGSLADYNRAGTPLLEIVTQPDLRSADEAVLLAQAVRTLVRFLGVSPAIMQKGHIRFEPNINTLLTLDDGRTVRTPIVEVKNLNSFRALRGAIEFEAREQPLRWAADGRVMGPGAKQTRGWDDEAQRTIPQRDKEDAHDYRYFPDPDLLPLRIDAAWRDRVRDSLPELPLTRRARYMRDLGLSSSQATALTAERDECDYFDAAVEAAVASGLHPDRAGPAVANLMLQSGLKRANERPGDTLISALGVPARRVGEIAALREAGDISAAGADELFGQYAGGDGPDTPARDLATARGLLLVRDDGALEAWCVAAIGAHPQAAQDVRAGKDAAIGRLVGDVMKRSQGRAEAAAVRAALLALLRP